MSTLYDILLVLHIVSVIGAFGPTFAGLTKSSVTKQTLPSVVLAAALGVGLVAASHKTYDMSQAWISAAFTIVILLVLDILFVLRPALERKEASDADSSNANVAVGSAVLNIGLLVIIVLMVFKPGV